MRMFIFVAMALSLVVGVVVFSVARKPFVGDRLLAAVLPPALVVALGWALYHVLMIPAYGVSEVRLACSYALSQGWPPYSIPNGPLLPTIYPPLFAILFLPAMMAATPLGVIQWGAAVSLLWCFAPMLWLVIREARGRARLPLLHVLGSVVLAIVLFLTCLSLQYGGFKPHADPPAMGLGLLACAVLRLKCWGDDRPRLGLSAVLVVCSVWTKQLTLPLTIALPMYIWYSSGHRVAAKYVLWLASAGVAACVLFGSIFGPSVLWQNIVVLPASQAWDTSITDAVLELLSDLAAPLAVFVYVMAALAATRTVDLRAHRFGLLALVSGLIALPSLMSRMRVGGGEYHASFSCYFMLVAAVLGLVELCRADGTNEGSVGRRLGVGGLAASLLLYVVLGKGVSLPFHLSDAQIARRESSELSRQAFEQAKRHPGQVFLPFHPLTMLMAGDKPTHSLQGLVEWSRSGFELDREQIEAHLSPNLRAVAYPPPYDMAPGERLVERGHISDSSSVVKFFSEFTQVVNVPELPGWYVVTRVGDSTWVVQPPPAVFETAGGAGRPPATGRSE